ncbi:MAG: 50S ribosomal protein L18e [Nanoarchaeota archaeon]|nr:50S ribosomal protein L18e [Nanoarchaeota archaeon]
MNKTKIERKLKRKTDKSLVETILSGKKNENWIKVAHIISGSRRNKINLNLGEIDKLAKDGEIIIVPGKVLSLGNITKKIEIVALSFSAKVIEKLEKSKIKYSLIVDAIKNNPEGKNVKILRGKNE